MKKSLFLFALLFVNVLAFGQLTKNLKEYKFADGLVVREGMFVKFKTGKNTTIKGVYLWAFQGTNNPIPVAPCDETFDGKEFEVKKVLQLKNYGNVEQSIIVMFEIDKKKFYCFVAQGIQLGEIAF